MTLTLQWSGLREWLALADRLEQVPEQVAARAQEVQQEALGHLILGAQANIYSTAPGAYRRTQDYLRSLDARAQVSKLGVTVTVRSSSPYALYIELGRSGLTPAALQHMAAAAGSPEQPLSLGRSGQQWWIAGPTILPAQYFAAWKLRQVLGEEWRRAISRTGA